MNLLKIVYNTIKSSILCIRFPFLYPRNRFTGNHYDCWKIIEYHRSNYTKANFFFTIDLINEDRKIEEIPLLDENMKIPDYTQLKGREYE